MIKKNNYFKIAVIEGDGIGPEVIKETVKVIKQVEKIFNIELALTHFPFSADYYLKTGITIPENFIEEIPRKFNAVLLGALGDPRVKSNKHADDILLGIRFKLELFANFRPIKLINKDYCPLKHIKKEDEVDFVIFRENTQDCYRNIGGILNENTPGEIAIESSLHTYRGIERILSSAFEYAQKNNCKSIVLGDKSNIMKFSGQLWQKLFFNTPAHPGIKKYHMYVDALSMEMIKNPAQFDVIVTSNMFGDILSDLAAQIQGGMGLAASDNFNPGFENFHGLFEPVHGSAPDIAGKNMANPIASILSFNLFLKKIGYLDIADCIDLSIKKVLDLKYVTPDLGGELTTSEVGTYICKYIKEIANGDDIS